MRTTAPTRKAKRMARLHQYSTIVTWTGNRGTGTSGYAPRPAPRTLLRQRASPGDVVSCLALMGRSRPRGVEKPMASITGEISRIHATEFELLADLVGWAVTGLPSMAGVVVMDASAGVVGSNADAPAVGGSPRVNRFRLFGR